MNPRTLSGIAVLLVAGWASAAAFLLSAHLGGGILFTGLFIVGARLVWLGVREPKISIPSDAPAPLALFALGAITMALLVVALWAIFVHAPVERQMGIVQKIFYFHVPSAYAMYVGFTTAAVGSAGYLITRRERWDALAVAGAEVGLLFCAIVLTTGPLWARKAWGVYWTWDPQLTVTLLAGLIFTAFVVLRSFGGAGEAEKRFAAALAIVGVCLLPIIHYSVKLWRGQHPVVVTRSEGGGLHPDMYPGFIISLVLFTALVALLVWARARAERMRQELEMLETEAAAQGLLEEL